MVTLDLAEYLFYEKRKNKDFSYEVFANKLAITRYQLSKILSGKSLPSPRVAQAICKHTDYQVDGWKILKDYYEKNSE